MKASVATGNQMGQQYKDLLKKIFAHNDRLPEDIRLALPSKWVWMLASQSD